MLNKISIYFLFLHLLFGQIACQVSLNNPFFWSGIINPNSQYSGRGYSIKSNSTQKTFSQDFQTVLYQKDIYGHTERVLVNFGDACNVPSVSDILSYNKNATFSQFIAAQSITALISRGGCDSWFKKVSNLQTFAYYNTQYQLRSVIIYDNNTEFDNNVIQLVTKNQNDPTQPQWENSTLYPISRNISSMHDNDISHNNTNSNQITLSVYFVPNIYGTYLINTLNDIYSTSSQYLQIGPYFVNKVFTDQDFNGNGNSGGNGGGNNNWGDGGLLGFGHKGNIAYIVAAVAAVVLAIVLFKWCRKRPQHEVNDPENGIGLQSTNRNNNEPPGISLEQLNTLCPIQTAGDSLIGMKYTTCAICLDDFKPTSTIRILPCYHSYCVDCIDFWLTKKSRFCPVCKNNVDNKDTDKKEDGEVDLGNSGMMSSDPTNNNENIPNNNISSLLPSTSISPPPSGINLNPAMTTTTTTLALSSSSSSSSTPLPSSPPPSFPSTSSPPPSFPSPSTSSREKTNDDSLLNESQSQSGTEQQQQKQQKQEQ
ncbi:unnamed protein product [Cunninghamella blakesleeana]